MQQQRRERNQASNRGKEQKPQRAEVETSRVEYFSSNIKLLNEVGEIIVVTLGRYGKRAALIKNSTATEGPRSEENVT